MLNAVLVPILKFQVYDRIASQQLHQFTLHAISQRNKSPDLIAFGLFRATINFNF